MMTSRLLPTPQESDYIQKKTSESWKKKGAVNFTLANPELMSDLLSSQADSPANPSVVLESEKEREMTATSGRICYESFKRQIPNGLLVKMSEVLLTSRTWNSKIVKLTWKMKPLLEEKIVERQASLFQSSMTSKRVAIPSKYLLFQLAPLTPRTEGIGCGLSDSYNHPLLPTPKANEIEMNAQQFHGVNRIAKDGREWGANIATAITSLPLMLKTPSTVECEGGIMEIRPGVNAHYKLRDQIAMLPTPTGQDVEHPQAELTETGRRLSKNNTSHSMNIADKIAMLPTPAARDYKGANPDNPYDCLDSLIEVGATKNQTGQKTGLKLQPAFVEWMMGYPENWTELTD
ncbi:MAG: hypothetical protein Q7J27_00490 [Syntrophales bacterium]|nr:hypothetical protein [Syntrophales bacterium]